MPLVLTVSSASTPPQQKGGRVLTAGPSFACAVRSAHCALRTATGLQLLPAHERPSERYLVGVVEVAAYRQSAGEPRHLDTERFEDPG